jgi:hypothetical protein
MVRQQKKLLKHPLHDVIKVYDQLPVLSQRNYITCLLVIGNATIDDSFSTCINNDKWQLDGRVCSWWTTLIFHTSISFNQIFE